MSEVAFRFEQTAQKHKGSTHLHICREILKCHQFTDEFKHFVAKTVNIELKVKPLQNWLSH